jgi:hypothetical protein
MILRNVLGGSGRGVFYDKVLEWVETVNIITENLSYCGLAVPNIFNKGALRQECFGEGRSRWY